MLSTLKPVYQMQLIAKLKQSARQLKSEAQVLIIVYRDKRTPLVPKVLIAITLGYLLSPIDLIPDFIPVLGLLDDLLIVPVLISISLKLIPSKILSEARESVKNNQDKLKKSNWFFASVIIISWLFMLYWIYSHFQYKWKK